MDPVPEQLAAYLNKMFPCGIYKTVYEAGFCGFWIHHKFTELGIYSQHSIFRNLVLLAKY